jgi:hypothetical protein
MDMLREGYTENGLFSFSEPRVRKMLARGLHGKPLNDGGGLIVGVIDGDGEFAGSIGILFEQYWYSEECSLTELWSFVRKPYRNSSYALDLIEFGKWAADTMGLSFGMGVMSTKRTEAKLRLYKRKLTPIGGYFMWGMNRNHGPLGREAV